MKINNVLRKFIIIITVIFFLSSLTLPVYAGYTLVPEFLCELGIKFYNEGNFSAALHEFNKALIAQPGYPPALGYIEKIKRITEIIPELEEKVVTPPTLPLETRAGAVKELLDKIERERGVIPTIAAPVIPKPQIIPPKKVYHPKILMLDEKLKELKSPLEIEQAKTIIIIGKNIKRFLVTQPEVLTVEKKSPDEVLITGKNFGYTYLHIWDEQDRWTLEISTIPQRPEGPTYQEQMRRSEERAGAFKLRYNLDWSSYEAGRRLKTLERSSYAYNHGLSLSGETPYGDLDSSCSVSSLKETTDLTYFTLGLTHARLGAFKNFLLRTFDYSPGFSNLAFGGASLRGVLLKSPAFNDKIDYTIFWGREGGGRYGGLSPSLMKLKSSFLGGFDMDWAVSKTQNYGFSILHGWGRDRESFLNPYAYDLNMNWNLDKFKFDYEVGYDSESFAHLVGLNYTIPKLTLTTQLRDVNKKYLSISGYGWQIGELGGLFGIYYTPIQDLSMSGHLNIFQDRLSPALDNDDRWNEDFDWDVTYTIDPLTSLSIDYSLQNELGRISQYRSYNQGVSIYKTFEFIKNINTSLSYRHQENKYFNAPTSDYINDKVYMGLRFGLIGSISYYLNKEFNWLQERLTSNRSLPEAMETGIDWAGQILKSPFYGNLRCTYRDEENTVSNLSFLSGEDYFEGYSELSYRPNPEKELYCSSRLRNVWADNPDVNKRIEADFRAGMRYLWNTGLRWEAISTVEGYVFKDLNADGLRQMDEPPVDGVKVWLGKDKSLVTDILGYYKFTKVKAKKAYVNIDTTTLPSGFVLTVPQTQEAMITYGQAARINFGITSRTEITGMVFEDIDADGQWDTTDLPVGGVIFILEDGSKTMTDDSGRYFFRKAAVGKHTLTLDLHSLSPIYIPCVPIFKDIELFEGNSYNYNIPLKKIER